MAAQDIIIKPVLSEKAYLNIPEKTYTFIVAKTATKTQIKQAIEEIFSVKVDSVNTMICAGKLKRMGRNAGYKPDTKKAIVQLSADSKAIEFFNSLS